MLDKLTGEVLTQTQDWCLAFTRLLVLARVGVVSLFGLGWRVD